MYFLLNSRHAKLKFINQTIPITYTVFLYIINTIYFAISFQSFLTVQNVTSSKRDITYI